MIETFTRQEFEKSACARGYGCTYTVGQYIKQNQKEVYTSDDFIELARMDRNLKDAPYGQVRKIINGHVYADNSLIPADNQ